MADDQNKHLERLIQLYENKSKNFEKYFAILIGISLFVFFFMLFPYVYLQIMERDLIIHLAINKEKFDKKLSEIKILNDTMKKMSVGNLTINKQIINLSNEFRELYVYLINNKTNDNFAQNNFITIANKCEIAYNTEQWVQCNLNHKSIEMNNLINKTFTEEIVFPIQQSNISKMSKVKINLRYNSGKYSK